MRLFPSDRYPLPLPEGHRFPASKYGRLRARLEAHAAAGADLAFVEPHAATDDEILRVHDRGYVGRVFAGTLSRDEIRRIGFPWSHELVERSLRSTGAAIDAAAAAIDDGRAASLALRLLHFDHAANLPDRAIFRIVDLAHAAIGKHDRIGERRFR